MITTIQIHENVKNVLDTLKSKGNESYEDVIINLISFAERQKRMKRELLIEGYKEMAEESLKINREWSAADTNWE